MIPASSAAVKAASRNVQRGAGGIAEIVGAVQAVESELRTLDANLADAEFYGGVVAIRSAGERDGEIVQGRGELVPGAEAVLELELRLNLGFGIRRGEFDGPVFDVRAGRGGMEPQGACLGLASLVCDGDADPQHMAAKVGIDLHILDGHRIVGAQRDFADDPIPYGLSHLTIGVRVVGVFVDVGVVHADDETMASGVERAEVIDVGCAEAILTAKGLAVHPDLGLPQASLQEQGHVFALPVCRNDDHALVPGRPRVDHRTAQPDEVLVSDGRIYKSLRRFLRTVHRIGERRALSCLVGRAGQLDAVRKVPGKPSIVDSFILLIKTEGPFAVRAS